MELIELKFNYLVFMSHEVIAIFAKIIHNARLYRNCLLKKEKHES